MATELFAFSGDAEDVIVLGRRRRDLETDVARIVRAITTDMRPHAGQEVLVLCHDRYFFACAMLAAWTCNLVVALPPSPQPDIVRALRQREGVCGVLHDSPGRPGLDVRALLETADEWNTAPAPIAPIASERVIVVVYTSGSTGASVACPKTAGQLLGEASVLGRTFQVSPSDFVVPSVPPHHIYGLLFGVLMPLLSRASFARETTLHVEPLAAQWNRKQGTILVAVPAHLRAFSTLKRDAFDHPPRVIFSSGAALPFDTALMLKQRFGYEVVEVLGSSETGGIAYRIAPANEPPIPTPFRPFEGIAVGTTEDGKLTVDSSYLAPEIARPWVTSDRVLLQPDGSFFHLGRTDGVIKVAGTRVSLQEIEARILGIEGVRECAVWAVEVGGARGQETRAVIAASEGLTVERVRETLRHAFDAVVIPRRMRIVEALPREATGKVRREALEALFVKATP
jgi:acyl-coenzyme A synthetase/AMP-(fatty) acid ligase